MILQRGGLIKFPEQKHVELLSNPDIPPNNPSIYDEEFDHPSGTLPAKWTMGTDTSEFIDYNRILPSHFYTKLSMAAAKQTGFSQPIPGDDFSITACGHSLNRLSINEWRIQVYDASVQLGVTIMLRTSSVTEYIMAYQRTSGSLYAVGTNFNIYRAGKMYLHLQKVGNTCTWWWSMDGLSWRRHYTMTKAFTPAYQSIIFASTATTAGNYATFAMDWIRYNWITLP